VTSRVTVTFEAWIASYPGSEGMNRTLALAEWRRLSAEDQLKAWNALPGFRQWIGGQAKNYTILSAHNFLIQRRFDGFAKTAGPPQGKEVYLPRGAPSWEAWEKAMASRGKPIPHVANGWNFPSEWPPDTDHQQREIPLLRKVAS
jgi:hypothetical protein